MHKAQQENARHFGCFRVCDIRRSQENVRRNRSGTHVVRKRSSSRDDSLEDVDVFCWRRRLLTLKPLWRNFQHYTSLAKTRLGPRKCTNIPLKPCFSHQKGTFYTTFFGHVVIHPLRSRFLSFCATTDSKQSRSIGGGIALDCSSLFIAFFVPNLFI